VSFPDHAGVSPKLRVNDDQDRIRSMITPAVLMPYSQGPSAASISELEERHASSHLCPGSSVGRRVGATLTVSPLCQAGSRPLTPDHQRTASGEQSHCPDRPTDRSRLASLRAV